jgi:hypothetical protein
MAGVPGGEEDSSRTMYPSCFWRLQPQVGFSFHASLHPGFWLFRGR